MAGSSDAADPPRTLRIDLTRNSESVVTRPSVPGKTRIRLRSVGQSSAEVAPIRYDQPVGLDEATDSAAWRERGAGGFEPSSAGAEAEVARAPEPPVGLDLPQSLAPLPLEAPNTAPSPTWTPRSANSPATAPDALSSDAPVFNRPYAASRAEYGPAYRMAKRTDDPSETVESMQSEADPFDDPFGDGVGTAPLTAEPGFRPAPTPIRLPGREDQLPTQTEDQAVTADTQPCNEVHNGVDCCREGSVCKHFISRVRSQTIQTISLDMTPSFKPGADKAEAEAEKTRRLSAVKEREWRDRQGRVLARGRFTDLRERHVIIATEMGEQRLRYWELSDIDQCYVTSWWSLPPTCNVGALAYQGRHFRPVTLTWKASGVCHRPLYFEQVQLERYGHTMGPWLQPTFSAAHFFASTITLPYHMGVHPMNECQYPLGHYRVGNCAPWLLPAVPLSVRGALMQTGAVLGGVYVLP